MAKTILAILICWVSVAMTIRAQDGGASLQVRFLTFGSLIGSRSLLLQEPGSSGDRMEVKLHLNNFTTPIQVGSRRFVLMEENGDELTRRAETTIPQKLGSKVLVVLVGAKRGRDEYEAIPMRDDRSGFGPGERRFVNLTKFPIGGEFDGQRKGIEPGAVRSLRIPAPPGGRDHHEVVFYYQEEDQWLPLSSTVWPYNPSQRSLVFFFWKPEEKRIRIRSIAEVPPGE